MSFDLRAALLRKEEVESARLADFDFRLRARTMRLLATALGRDADGLVARIAHEEDATIIADLGAEKIYDHCRAEARQALIAERGDPAPHRLA